MAHSAESLERAEHTAHAGHHGGGGESLATLTGMTMAILGVLLAVAAARVGYERAELVQYLVEQQHAHAKYQAQDVKHRMSVLALRQLHALKPESPELTMIANSVNRYLAESQVAARWVDSYDPVIAAHSDAQEEYEHAQLAAELGVVLASVALLLRRRSIWLIAILLGIAAVILTGVTWRHTAHRLHESEPKIAETEKAYHDLRAEGNTGDIDQALVDQILKR
jgi:hypothetical protein